MRPFPAALAGRLDRLESEGLHRRLRPASGIDLSSNDYLGFATDPVLSDRLARTLSHLPVGSTGSRLLRGESALLEEVEAALARFVGRDAALLFPSGYQANVALLSALLRSGDAVFSDELNHASIIDGIRMGRAERVIYPHGDHAALRRALQGFRPPGAPQGLRVIVTESLFSVDGDAAPLSELAGLAEEFSALLIVDEAHATGLFGSGPTGGGLVQALGLSDRVFATVHTGGKALGAGGAWVAGDPDLKNYLVNVARPFIFSTAPIPALAVLLNLVLGHWHAVGEERAREVLNRAAAFRNTLRAVAAALPKPVPGLREPVAGPGFREPGLREPGLGPILPFVIGDNRRAVRTAARLQRQGFDARAIRPPTVPEGTARLRITVTWPVAEATLHRFAEALRDALDDEDKEVEP
jgi:8-amino-7-oxononanoate synthase